MAVAYAIQPNKKKIILLFAGSLLFVGISTFMLLDKNRDTPAWLPSGNLTTDIVAAFNSYKKTVVSIAAILFFGACAIASLHMLLSNRSLLRINQKGVDYSRTGMIPWADIRGFRIFEMPGKSKARMLLIDLIDTDTFIKHFPKWRQPVMRTNVIMCGSPVCLPASMFKESLEDLLERFNQQLIHYKE